jgi:carbon-monoxide dehydrogenase small subunit
MSMVTLIVNGKAVSADVPPRTNLADFLRDTQNLTGTHIGCEHGVCGACTLLVDGVPTRSCITFAVACQQAEVTTIEGLDNDEIARELRAAFSAEHALQCGYCTPGMMVSARDVVLRMEAPTEHDIRFLMSGNLCRCTGYVGITRAIQRVVEARRARGIAAIPNGNRTALGPSGSGHAVPVAATPSARAAAGPAAAKKVASSSVASDMPRKEADWKPQTNFTQSFTVAHPVDVVWDFFGNIPEVASCLPGASLAGDPVGGHVEGQIKVKVGPISAEFHGVADVTRDDATRTGTIDGAGKDKRSNSATRGLIGYAVKQGDNPGETRVDVNIGFTLTGVLAQFSRSGLVQDVAGRLIGAFVKNLEAKLSHQASGGTGAAPVVTELDAGSLVFSVIASRFKSLWARITGSRRDAIPAIADDSAAFGSVETVPAAPSPAPTAAKQASAAPAALRKDPDWKPQTNFPQSFTVAHPVDVVWDFFGNIPEVASCLPGASLVGDPVDGHVEGQIKVKVGPISAEFHGVADVTRDDATRTGTIDGAGRDKRSNSATRGLISYAVKQGDNPGETRVDVNIGFTLTGVLAQFSRSGLVEDVAGRLIGAFVKNLEAKLSHRAAGGEPAAAPVVTELDAGSLVFSVIASRFKMLWAKITGRRT